MTYLDIIHAFNCSSGDVREANYYVGCGRESSSHMYNTDNVTVVTRKPCLISGIDHRVKVHQVDDLQRIPEYQRQDGQDIGMSIYMPYRHTRNTVEEAMPCEVLNGTRMSSITVRDAEYERDECILELAFGSYGGALSTYFCRSSELSLTRVSEHYGQFHFYSLHDLKKFIVVNRNCLLDEGLSLSAVYNARYIEVDPFPIFLYDYYFEG